MTALNTDWFETREIAKQVWAIDDHGQDTIYLVTGKERALLIDVGWGIGDLPELVRSLTSLPVTVVLTHGHPDHVCGSFQFAAVHIGAADLPLLRGNFRKADREWMMQHPLQDALPRDFSPDQWLGAELNQVIPIEAGHTFDLGERKLKVIAIPGHTPGCIGLLDEEAGLLFSGDAILQGQIWMFSKESLPLGAYLRSLQHVNSLRGKFDKLLPGHAATPVSVAVIQELIDGVTDILAGRRQGVYHHTFIGDGLFCEFNSCGVVYNPERL